MAKGTDAQFDQISALLLDNAKKYEAGAHKYIKYVDNLDAILGGQYGWHKAEYYDELNKRLGIVNNDVRREQKEIRTAAMPKTQKKTRKKPTV